MSQLLRRDPVFGPVDRLFNQFISRDPLGGIASGLASLAEDEGTLALDIADDGETLVVTASLPGYQREGIALEINDNVLTITARQLETAEDEGARDGVQFVRRERRVGTVTRRVTLPAVVDRDGARATLADGVLTLRLPKSERHLPRRIAID